MKREWICAGCKTPQLGGKATRVYCSWACLSEARIQATEALNAERTRTCPHCSSEFIVKKSQIDSGHGTYCSHRCAYDAGAHGVLLAEETKQRAIANRAASILVNGTQHKSGPLNPGWRGGKEATKRRGKAQARARCRQYRARNPERCREWVRTRKNRKIGERLPRGTVKRIGEAQRWRCAVCTACIKKRYHVDHITPLAKGGKHEPLNLQLLCPSCNVRKSAKDPIAFMQERGFLL